MSILREYAGLATRVLMGAGAADQVADEVRRLGGTRVMLLSGRTTGRSVLAARVAAQLGPLLVDTFDSVVEHSSVATVTQAAQRARDARVDLFVALGGGSASDTAKGAAILLAEGAPLHRHANRFTPPDQIVQQQLDQPKIAILAIPTTASAAEVTPGAGIRDEDGHKLLLWDVKVAARTILLDPAANLAVPVPIMTGSSMNALAHCIEGLYSKRRNPIAEAFALQGLRLLSEGLTAMARDPADVEARAAILYGAHVSGLTIASTRTCLHHGICHSLGSLGGLSHGNANSIMLPHAMRFNLRAAAPQLKLAAIALGVDVAGLSDTEAGERAVGAVERLQRTIGVPTRLRDTGLDHGLLPAIAQQVMGDRALYFNPGPTVTPAEVRQVLEAAW